jgi:hypothetical protein
MIPHEIKLSGFSIELHFLFCYSRWEGVCNNMWGRSDYIAMIFKDGVPAIKTHTRVPECITNVLNSPTLTPEIQCTFLHDGTFSLPCWTCSSMVVGCKRVHHRVAVGQISISQGQFPHLNLCVACCILKNKISWNFITFGKSCKEQLNKKTNLHFRIKQVSGSEISWR